MLLLLLVLLLLSRAGCSCSIALSCTLAHSLLLPDKLCPGLFHPPAPSGRGGRGRPGNDTWLESPERGRGPASPCPRAGGVRSRSLLCASSKHLRRRAPWEACARAEAAAAWAAGPRAKVGPGDRRDPASPGWACAPSQPPHPASRPTEAAQG